MGFNFDIQYKKGKENVATDALSHIQDDEGVALMAISVVSSDLLQQIKDS